MPANRHALIRYKTIDQCLQNRRRKWTLEDLMEKVSDALYEYEGSPNPISKRTIQLDIQAMRSDKLGYNAPIIVKDKKYYTYEDATYSITNIPLTDQDLDKLGDAIDFLKQFNGFSHFKELSGMVHKLEDHIVSVKRNKQPIIDFESNPDLKGIEYLDLLYKAILDQKVITITYKSFKAKEAAVFSFNAFLLKEFNNRWFVIGNKSKDATILNLALDRIEDVVVEDKKSLRPKDFDPSNFFKDVIGVTVNQGQLPEKISFWVGKENAPYVVTKPFHSSQVIIEENERGTIFEIAVKINYELERVLLGYGEHLEVLGPRRLRNKMKKKLQMAADLYKDFE
jgi:predicted DNA-binding transcriptional regulator YafY